MFNLQEEIENEKLRIEVSSYDMFSKQNLAEYSEDQKVLKILSKDDDWIIRLQLTKNSNIGKELLLKLTEDNNIQVSWSATKHIKEKQYV